MRMNELLKSSGWSEGYIKEGTGEENKFKIELKDSVFSYHEKDGVSYLYMKEKYKNSNIWGSMEPIKTGEAKMIGMFLAQEGLLNEIEYGEAKKLFEEEQRIKREMEERHEKMMKRESVLEGGRVFLKELISASKKVALGLVVLVGGYTLYQYEVKNLTAQQLYTYIKSNINEYSIEELITNPQSDKLTYSQIRNIDYAIENEQIEELLDKVDDSPKNKNYKNALSENLKKFNVEQ